MFPQCAGTEKTNPAGSSHSGASIIALLALRRHQILLTSCRESLRKGLIRARTGEGRERAKARGVKMGRKPKLTPHQQAEAIKRRDAGEPIRDIARSYNVHNSTISRLAL
jgi:Helix-turn-helix domain of resolvase